MEQSLHLLLHLALVLALIIPLFVNAFNLHLRFIDLTICALSKEFKFTLEMLLTALLEELAMRDAAL